MLFNVGDLVTRKSHNHDIVFKIIDISNDKVYLKGLNIRLIADSVIDDLVFCDGCEEQYFDDDNALSRMNDFLHLNRDDYFYLPGKILHIDADEDYLNRCLKFYKDMNILSYGVVSGEKDLSNSILDHLNKIKPNIVVITGHDAYFDNGDFKNINNYKNSKYFIDAVIKSRDYENNPNKLIIIAGACQSNYEELIKAGANFASSPRRINIHALDPAIIASSVALSDQSKSINLINILEKTKYGKEGIGGIITNGVMYVGYPR